MGEWLERNEFDDFLHASLLLKFRDFVGQSLTLGADPHLPRVSIVITL